MKVLQINAVYGYTSTGVITKDIQQCCLDNDIDAYVAFSKGHGIPNDHTYEIGNILDCKVHALLSRIAGKQAYFSHCTTKKLLKYIDSLHPDIVHLHNLHNNYINLNMILNYLAKKDVKTIITFHDCWYFTGGCFHYTSVDCKRWQIGCGNCPKQKIDTPALLWDASKSILKNRIKNLSAIKNITIVGASEWVASECKKSMLGIKNVTFIHNGFDLSIFKPSPSDFKQKLGIEGKFVILGPASKWLLPINKPTLDFFISHMDDNSILLLFGGNGIESISSFNVKMYGFTHNRKELAQLYSMADVMVNVSREDTLSSLNLECQACGTPVVTYDATGNKETVDGQCGFAVETGDFESLFEMVLRIKHADKESLKTACVDRITHNFEKQNNYLKYIKLYKSIAQSDKFVRNKP